MQCFFCELITREFSLQFISRTKENGGIVADAAVAGITGVD
jgi:hypothetical protein